MPAEFVWETAEEIHMLTAAALLELDFEQPSLDYHSLMKLTKILTHDCEKDVEEMFRRMCFNVFAHNRDDHSKNFSFLYDESKEEWKLSPAYGLTYSTTYYGEHTTTVDGEGANPGRKELMAVGLQAGISKPRCMNIILVWLKYSLASRQLSLTRSSAYFSVFNAEQSIGINSLIFLIL